MEISAEENYDRHALQDATRMPLHIETHEIRVFKTVVEENGFKRAADKLFVTQSAVSQTISNLEKKLDTVLLERNPLRLTETGIRLLHYAEAVLGEEGHVLRDISNIKHGILSTVLLATNSTVNVLFLARLIDAFLQTSPLTRLKVDVMPSRQLNAGVSSDHWELGFGPFQQKMPPNLATLPLFDDTRSLVVSSRHVREGDLQSSSEHLLREVPLVVSHLEDPDIRPAIQKLRDSFGTIWEINDLDLRIKLIASGHAMGYIDSMILRHDQRCADFVPVAGFPFASMQLTFGLIQRERKQLSAGAQRFIEVCQSFDFSTRT